MLDYDSRTGRLRCYVETGQVGRLVLDPEDLMPSIRSAVGRVSRA
jgi:hypothetical protein